MITRSSAIYAIITMHRADTARTARTTSPLRMRTSVGFSTRVPNSLLYGVLRTMLTAVFSVHGWEQQTCIWRTRWMQQCLFHHNLFTRFRDLVGCPTSPGWTLRADKTRNQYNYVRGQAVTIPLAIQQKLRRRVGWMKPLRRVDINQLNSAGSVSNYFINKMYSQIDVLM